MKEIEKLKSSPYLYLYGEDDYLRRDVTLKVKAYAKKHGWRYEAYTPSSIEDLVDTCYSSGFTSSKRLVHVSDVSTLKGSMEVWTRYLKEPDAHTVLLLESVKETGSFCKSLKGGNTHHAKPLSSYGLEIDNWIVQECKTYGKSLSLSYAKILRNAIGDDLWTLHHAVKKIIAHADSATIESTDIAAVLVKQIGPTVYDVVNMFLDRDLKKFITSLDQFFRYQENDPSIYLCMTLMGHMETVLRAKSLLDYGLDIDQAAQVLSVSPYMFRKNTYPTLSKWSIAECVSAHKDLCHLDTQLKGNILSGRLLIESAVTLILGDRV